MNADFAKYKPILPKYTPIKEDQLELLAQPYLRGFKDLNETDLKSYQALVDVFIKEGVMSRPAQRARQNARQIRSRQLSGPAAMATIPGSISLHRSGRRPATRGRKPRRS